jgi:hypothetical protein
MPIAISRPKSLIELFSFEDLLDLLFVSLCGATLRSSLSAEADPVIKIAATEDLSG